MTIESDADRQAFMETFGVPVVISGETITGIFDNIYYEDLDVDTSQPMVMIITADAPNVDYDQSVIVSSASFSGTVTSVQPDGQGMTTLILKSL